MLNISFKVDKELGARFKQKCSLNGWSMLWVIGKLITLFLESDVLLKDGEIVLLPREVK